MSNALKNVFIDIAVRPWRKQVFEGYRMERFVRAKSPNATLAKEKDLIIQSLFQNMFRDVV